MSLFIIQYSLLSIPHSSLFILHSQFLFSIFPHQKRYFFHYLCPMSKVLAIDFGLKRTGLALSDDAKMFAFGLETIASENLMGRCIELVETESVDEIALGLPKRLNNEDAHITENVRLLKEALEAKMPGVRVVLVDERFTSKMASSAMHAAGASKKQKRQKELIDKVSATIILQSYLEAR